MIGAASKFKRGTGRDAHIVLVPQPSQDPNDPYVSCSFNYQLYNSLPTQIKLASLEKGSMFLDTVCYLFCYRKTPCSINLLSSALTSTLDGALGPMVGPGYVLLSAQFGVSVDEVSSAFGAMTIGLACFM